MSAYTDARKRMQEQADQHAAPAQHGHHCDANGCPLAGSMSQLGGTGGRWCAYHFNALMHDLPRITAVLEQHMAMVNTLAEGRSTLAGGSVPPEQIAGIWQTARQRLDDLGYDIPPPRSSADSYAHWLYRVETMLGGLVVQARSFKRAAA